MKLYSAAQVFTKRRYGLDELSLYVFTISQRQSHFLELNNSLDDNTTLLFDEQTNSLGLIVAIIENIV